MHHSAQCLPLKINTRQCPQLERQYWIGLMVCEIFFQILTILRKRKVCLCYYLKVLNVCLCLTWLHLALVVDFCASFSLVFGLLRRHHQPLPRFHLEARHTRHWLLYSKERGQWKRWWNIGKLGTGLCLFWACVAQWIKRWTHNHRVANSSHTVATMLCSSVKALYHR